eukprot:COSAG01_NODE_202_length_22130_cov_167.927239_5_plen_84_part_00
MRSFPLGLVLIAGIIIIQASAGRPHSHRGTRVPLLLDRSVAGSKTDPIEMIVIDRASMPSVSTSGYVSCRRPKVPELVVHGRG